MKIILNPPREQWKHLLMRPAEADTGLEGRVSELLGQMREGGWDTVAALTRRFDGYDPQRAGIAVESIHSSAAEVPEGLKLAIAQAAQNILTFHEAQRRTEDPVKVAEGITCYRKWVPIERIGLYIPGGTAPLISTVLMLSIPAKIAGCREIVLCTPANRDGKIDPAILYAAHYCGISTIFPLGGAQAIAAMAYGLGSVPKVDKLFGPGNSYVTMAKQLVSRDGVAIDMPAGPSEVAIIADDSCSPAFVAADLLSQAEHGPDSQALFITCDWDLAEQVRDEVEIQLQRLPRKDIARKALDSSLIIVVPEEEELISLVNSYAPEHLIISTRNYRELSEKVTNAGSVFLGPYTPESAGDYASGTNHTLPTSGYARAYSGLSLDSFMKAITFQELTQKGLLGISDAIITMARAEGLEGHARAVLVRAAGQRSVETDHYPSLRLLPVAGCRLPVRKNILGLTPYSSARDEFSGMEGIFLDANENPNDTGLNRYPDPHQRKLKEKVAALKGVNEDQLFLGNGSDEAIDLLIRIFCEPGRSRIITMSPTYGMYKVCAGIQDVAVDPVLLNPDFSLNTLALLGAVRFDTRMIFLCSPNNPTGNSIPVEEIVQLAEGFSGIVVVDEAYIDFSSGSSALSILADYPNLVVLQTFSKAWGMAGARVGMAFADPEIISLMDKVKYPYNLSTLAQEAVRKKIEGIHVPVGASRRAPGNRVEKVEEVEKVLHQSTVVQIVAERERLADALKTVPCVEKVFPSEANFLLIKVTNAKSIYNYLVGQGIVVRDRSSQPLCENCLRITVGTPEENDAVVSAFERL
jgi:histidinol-phosphate aminotransferase